MTALSDIPTYDVAGLLRCCLEAVPTGHRGEVLAGKEGEHRPCPHANTHPDGGFHNLADSGVTYRGGVWRAAWIKETNE